MPQIFDLEGRIFCICMFYFDFPMHDSLDDKKHKNFGKKYVVNLQNFGNNFQKLYVNLYISDLVGA